LGGLAKNNTTYIQKILAASKGRVPFDVINIHTYCTDDKDGYSPENESFGLEKNLSIFMDWCKKTLPDIPVWLTEFGWDTYSTPAQHSYVFAPAPQQANYIIRSYFVALKMGFEKAFMFMDKDPNSSNVLQYSSSGIITDQASGLAKKTSFYYMATLQKTLGDAVFNRVVSYRKPAGNNEVYCFEFTNSSQETVYALWTRIKNSKTDSGTTLSYTLDLGYQPEYANLITLKDKDLDGVKTTLEITGKTLPLTLNETPQFVVVAANKTGFNSNPDNEFEFRIYPNPAKNETQIRINNPKFQKIAISAYSPEGKKVAAITDKFINAGVQYYSFGKNIAPGIYFIAVTASGIKKTAKVIIQ